MIRDICHIGGKYIAIEQKQFRFFKLPVFTKNKFMDTGNMIL